MRTAAALIASLLCVAIARPVQAQPNQAWDLFAGYAYLRDPVEELTLPTGWAAGGAVHLKRWLSVVADAGGHYKTVPLIGGDVRVTTHSVMVGGRASVPVGPFVEFIQILFGPVQTSGSAFGLTNRETILAGQGGVGVDVPLKRKWAARLQFDLRILENSHEYRAIAGLVYVR